MSLIDTEKFNISNKEVCKIVLELKKILLRENFTQSNLSKKTGKQVVRYTHLFKNDKKIIQTQLFNEDQNILHLYNLFLLDESVPVAKIKNLLGENLYSKMLNNKILHTKDNNQVGSNISITPFSNQFFFNEGHREFESLHIHQVSRSQNYLFEVTNLLKEKLIANKNNKILDLCSGSGALGMSVSELNSKIYGADLNPRAVEFAKINALLNSRNANYIQGDSTNANLFKEKFNLLVANPPFHGLIKINSKDLSENRLIVHSGEYGDNVINAILNNLDALLESDGNAVIVANWLLKNNKLSYPAIKKLTDNGTLILFHDPLVPAMSWEGIRTLYSFSMENFEKIPNGFFESLLNKAHFNQVCFGVLCWLKDKGPKGFHLIENTVERDTSIISKWAKLKVNELSEIS